MPISIKNPEVDSVLQEIVSMTGESKTQAVLQALLERRNRIVAPTRRASNLRAFLETQIWPLIPPDQLGRELSREQMDEVLGYGSGGI